MGEKRSSRGLHNFTFKAWLNFLDKNGNGHVDINELRERCQDVGYEGDPQFLFKCFIARPSLRYITLTDWDVPAATAQLRGDYRMLADDKLDSGSLSVTSWRPETIPKSIHGRGLVSVEFPY